MQQLFFILHHGPNYTQVTNSYSYVELPNGTDQDKNAGSNALFLVNCSQFRRICASPLQTFFSESFGLTSWTTMGVHVVGYSTTAWG